MAYVNKYHMFNQQLLEKYDKPARKAVIDYFANQKHIDFKEHPNKYDVDLINEEKNLGMELEVKSRWNGADYPFSSVHILKRKKHLFDGSHDLDNYLIVLNNSFDSAIAIRGKNLLPFLKDENLQEIQCFDGTTETVYDVPLSAFKEIHLN